MELAFREGSVGAEAPLSLVGRNGGRDNWKLTTFFFLLVHGVGPFQLV